MKKFLLLSVLGLAGMSASALTDITPANYIFNNVKEFNYHTKAFGTSNFAAPVWKTVEGDTYYKDGLAVICGAVVGWGTGPAGARELVESPDGPSIMAGTSLVNLGGEIGQVLAISGMNSEINKRLKDLYGVDMNIPNCTAPLHWFNINFFTDPNSHTKDGSDDYYNVRCRITCNFYANNITDGVSFVNAFLVGDQNNIPDITSNAINTDNFIKLNEEDVPVDDNGDESEEYYWDPERWMVYEVNMKVMADTDDGVTYAPIRLKYDVKADPLQSGTMFIKSIEFFIPTQEEAVNTGAPQTHMITLKADPKPNSIRDINADSTIAKVNLNGRAASFNESAAVFTTTGMQVAKVAANEQVSLQPGIYVANVSGKSVKFVVK